MDWPVSVDQSRTQPRDIAGRHVERPVQPLIYTCPEVVNTSPNPQPVSPTSVWLSETDYLIHSQLLSKSGGRSSIRNLRTRQAMVTGSHLCPNNKFI
jgi:hypothetical protein